VCTQYKSFRTLVFINIEKYFSNYLGMHIRIIHIPSKIHPITKREPVLVDVDPAWTVKQLKDRIAQQINVPSDHQFLSFNGRTLENEYTLVSYDDIKDESTISMVIYPRSPGGIRVFISIHTYNREGEVEDMDLDISYTDTVAQVKQAIFERTSIPILKQALIFAGNMLNDARVFVDYNASNDSTVHLIIKK